MWTGGVWIGVWIGGVWIPCPHPLPVAGGTFPTGMHSCLILSIGSLFFSVELCLAGSQWNDTACVDCEISWYKSADGNVDPCLQCPEHELTLQTGARACSKNL